MNLQVPPKVIQVYADEESQKVIRKAAKRSTLSLGAYCRQILVRESRKVLKEESDEREN